MLWLMNKQKKKSDEELNISRKSATGPEEDDVPDMDYGGNGYDSDEPRGSQDVSSQNFEEQFASNKNSQEDLISPDEYEYTQPDSQGMESQKKTRRRYRRCKKISKRMAFKRRHCFFQRTNY